MRTWVDARVTVVFALLAATISIAAGIHACGLRPPIIAAGALSLAALFTMLWAVGEETEAHARHEVELRRIAAELEGATQQSEGVHEAVSQEMRSEMRAIDGFSQILENAYGSQLDREGMRTLARLRAGAGRMSRMMEDLLRFSELGRRHVVWEPVDVDAIVREVVGGLLAKYPGAKVRVETLPRAAGDPFLIRQAWTELLRNALKFSAATSEPEVEVSGTSLGTEVEYRVRDNGAGFDMAERHRLFGVFQRLHRPDEPNGTGIGLAIVRLVTARHGGRVRAEGRPGQGATFSFTLPKQPPLAST